MIDRLIDWILQDLAPIFKPIWDSVVLWRVFSLVLVLAIAVVYWKRERIASLVLSSQDALDHDRKVLADLEGLLPQESLESFLDSLIGDNSYRASARRKVQEFTDSMSLERNQFMNRRLNEAASNLHSTLFALIEFLAYHFFTHPKVQAPGEDFRYCLYPEHNIDRGGSGTEEESDFYEKHRTQLVELGRKTEANYKEWRKVARECLSI